MKQVKIRIVGDLLIFNYCTQNMPEDEEEYEDFSEFYFDHYYVTGAWERLTAMYVDDNEEENVIKEKGKYVKSREYFHNLFKEDGEHPLPVEIHARTYISQELEYVIELPDDEEFDIKKVQLIKSDYEIDVAPYFILCEKILYDGKDVEANLDYNNWTDYCPDEKMYNTLEVTDFCY